MLPVCAEDGSLRLVVFNKAREYLDDLLRTVLEASPDGIMGLRCVRAADGRIEDAVVVTANHRAADIVGCSVEGLLDRPILDVIPKLRGSKSWARYLEVVETRQPQQFELSLGRRGSGGRACGQTTRARACSGARTAEGIYGRRVLGGVAAAHRRRETAGSLVSPYLPGA